MEKPQFASAFTLRTNGSISAHDKQRIKPAPSAIRALFFIVSLPVFLGCSVARLVRDEAPSELQNSLVLSRSKRKPAYFAGGFAGGKYALWYLATFTFSHSPWIIPSRICAGVLPLRVCS